MVGVSASLWPALPPLDPTCAFSQYPTTTRDATRQEYGVRSETLARRNLAFLRSSYRNPDSWCTGNGKYAKGRCSSRQQQQSYRYGSNQFQPLSYTSLQLKRECERRSGFQQKRLSVVAKRTMKFQQLFRNAVSSSFRCFRRPLPRGIRQFQVLTSYSRGQSKKRRRAQQKKGMARLIMKTWQSTGDRAPVGKRNWTERLSSEDSDEDEDEDVTTRSKKARRDLKVSKARTGFSFYDFLKECDRTWEERILGDTRRLETACEGEEHCEENRNYALSTTTTNPGNEKRPKYPQTDTPFVTLSNNENGAEVYVLGTSHVSRESVDQVRKVIERVEPDYVLVELCRKRYYSLALRKSGKMYSFVDRIAEKLTKGSASSLGKLLGAAVAGFSRVQPHQSSYPGHEFQVAVEEGMRVGAKIVLGDQDIDKTLRLLGDFDLNMSMEEAFRLFGQPMPADLAQALGTGQNVSKAEMLMRFTDRKVIRRFNEEMQKGAPHIYKILVDDRNEIMAKALRSLRGKVVAVVGLAHVDGLEQLWHEYNA